MEEDWKGFYLEINGKLLFMMIVWNIFEIIDYVYFFNVKFKQILRYKN